jgi:ABC-type nickel/cobalt efflux system permease component RcnA
MKKTNFLPLILIVMYHLLISKNYNVPFWIEILSFVFILILCGWLAYRNHQSEQKLNFQAMLIIGTIFVSLSSFLYFFNF